MAQLKKFELTVSNLLTGRTHVTEVIAESKHAAEEEYYVKLASTVIYGDARGKFRVKATMVGYVSASGITRKQAAALNMEAKSRSARRKARRKAAADARAAKQAAMEASVA